jgi:basic membrane lipoprotein Med (substrate-binding protein (PBP1-ABC) superfamily)
MMKKTIFIAFLMFFALSASTAFAKNANLKNASDNAATKENRLTDEEVSRMTKRVEEIRNMDKSELTATEKSELRKELKTTKEKIKKDGGGYIYIGGGTLLLVIILIIILL